MTVRTSLARLVRRDPDRPTLRERAATLRASASRLLHRREAEPRRVTDSRHMPSDWASPPEGFMAFPSLNPECFLALRLAIPKEALRLHRLAQAELDRVTAPSPYGRDLDPDEVQRRRELRVDELRAAAFGQAEGDLAQIPSPSSDEVGRSSRLAGYSRAIVELRNRLDDTALPNPFDDEAWQEDSERLTELEYALFDQPARDAADLAIKVRHAARYLEPKGHDDPAYPDLLEVRAWQGIAADVERLARGTPIAATVMLYPDGRRDPKAREVPILHDTAGFSGPVLHAIEAARTASRRARETLPGTTAEERQAAEAEASRRTYVETMAYQDVFRLLPTTREGLFALVDFARERAAFHAERAEDGHFATTPDVLGAIRDGMAMLLDDVREDVEPDHVHRVIARHHAARALSNGWPEDEGPKVDALLDREEAAWTTMVSTRPTTLAGLLALVRAIEAGGGAGHGPEKVGAMLCLIGDTLAGLMRPPAETAAHSPKADRA